MQNLCIFQLTTQCIQADGNSFMISAHHWDFIFKESEEVNMLKLDAWLYLTYTED